MRMRFNTAEKALIVSGAPVEVRTGRYWHPAVIADATVQCTHGTFQHVLVRITSGKYKGQSWQTSPTALRAAATPEG